MTTNDTRNWKLSRAVFYSSRTEVVLEELVFVLDAFEFCLDLSCGVVGATGVIFIGGITHMDDNYRGAANDEFPDIDEEDQCCLALSEFNDRIFPKYKLLPISQYVFHEKFRVVPSMREVRYGYGWKDTPGYDAFGVDVKNTEQVKCLIQEVMDNVAGLSGLRQFNLYKPEMCGT